MSGANHKKSFFWRRTEPSAQASPDIVVWLRNRPTRYIPFVIVSNIFGLPRWLARWSLTARRSIPKFVSISPGRSWGVAPIKEHYFSCSKLKEHSFVIVATSTLVLTTKTTTTTATHQKSGKLKLTTCKNQHGHDLNLFLLTPNYFIP